MSGQEIIIIPSIEKDSGRLYIKDYDSLITQAQEFINFNSVFTQVNNEDDFRDCKKERAALNKALKNIQDARKKIVKYSVGEFEEQCKSIEKQLKEASELHSQALEAYQGEEEPQSDIRLEIKVSSNDLEALKKVQAYAKKYGCTVKVPWDKVDA